MTYTGPTRTVHHRDGTETEYRQVRVGLKELARRIAIWTRLATPRIREDDLDAEVITERNATRLRVARKDDGRQVRITKTAIGDYFQYIDRKGRRHGVYIEALDARGATFEEPQEPNCWILGDWFCI